MIPVNSQGHAHTLVKTSEAGSTCVVVLRSLCDMRIMKFILRSIAVRTDKRHVGLLI